MQKRLGGYIKLNVDDRRKAVAELADEGLSQRAIGEVVGVSQMQVKRDMAETNVSKSMEESAQIETNVSEPADPVSEKRAAKEAVREERREVNRALVQAAPR